MLLVSNNLLQKIFLKTRFFLRTIYLTKSIIVDLLKNILIELLKEIARKLLFAFNKYI